jgi:hypothetical protein
MAYTDKNFKSGKELKEAFANGQTLTVYSPGPFPLRDGPNVIEGPHYPEAHKFYVQVTIQGGVLVAMKGVKRKTAATFPTEAEARDSIKRLGGTEDKGA